jgi:transposase
MAGRRTTLTPELQATIIAAVRAGNAFGPACEAAGLSAWTGYEWLRRGRGDDPDRPATPLYAQFAEAVRQAETADELETIARLKRHGERRLLENSVTVLSDGTIIATRRWSVPNARAMMWHLERKYPHRWGRRRRLEINTSAPVIVRRTGG